MAVDYATIRVEFDATDGYRTGETLAVEHPFTTTLNDSGRLTISRHDDPVYEFRHVSRYSVSPPMDFWQANVEDVVVEQKGDPGRGYTIETATIRHVNYEKVQHLQKGYLIRIRGDRT